MLKTKNGITLIALIITIIVLLILAGVTINMVMGENGIINKSKTSVAKYENAQEKENTALAGYETVINSYIVGERGTVSLTEEEYTLFKSQFSKNTDTPVVSINMPNTWVIGKEYQFENDLYGQRFTGNITANANVRTLTLLNSTLTSSYISNIIQTGGYWVAGLIGSKIPVNTALVGTRWRIL